MNQKQVTSSKITPDVIKNSAIVECECGGKIFVEKLVFKKLSALISPSGNEELIPLPLLICEKCGKMPRIFDPTNLIPDEFKCTN